MSRYRQNPRLCKLPDGMKNADWIVDLGPDGGEYGGRIVAAGTPEQICRSEKSYTAAALRKVLGGGGAAAA
jgi:excinuclease UvrABC ATPase subunit